MTQAILDITKPEGALEEIYDLVKELVELDKFKIKDIEALLGLISELLNRMKEGEYSGK